MLAGECYGTSMSFKTLCVVRLKFILSLQKEFVFWGKDIFDIT